LLIESVEKFYKLKPSNPQKIIEDYIYTITKLAGKPFKSGLIDFTDYLDLYSYIIQNKLERYQEIIIKNNRFFKVLLNYDKEIKTSYTFPQCISIFAERYKEYKNPPQSLLWMLQQIIAGHVNHIPCAFNIMIQLFNFYIAEITPDLEPALIHIFTINIDARYTKIFTLFLQIFFEKYKEIDIEDADLANCKAVDSKIITCSNNFSFRLCNETAKEYGEEYDLTVMCPK
jgi:lipopolysaccharide biosynthesis glycosyltransferase